MIKASMNVQRLFINIIYLKDDSMTKRAFCFDLSGTITKEEIVPLLAKQIGMYGEIETLTESAINGLIPPKKSFLLRSELINNIPLSRSQEIISNIELHPQIFEFIQNNNQNCFIITLALEVWLKKLMEKIPCKFYCSKAEYENDKVTNINSITDKAQVITQIKEDFDEVIAIGGDMGDVSMLEKADVGIAFAGVHEPISSLIEESDFVTFSEAGLCNILNTLL